MHVPLWLTLTGAAVVCWGVAASSLKPLSTVQLHPAVLSGAYGLVQVAAAAAILLRNHLTAAGGPGLAWPGSVPGTASVWILTYAVLSTAAGYMNILATRQRDAVVTVVSALGSCYPAVTMTLNFLWFHESARVRLGLAVPGLLLICAGGALLAVSRKPPSSVRPH